MEDAFSSPSETPSFVQQNLIIGHTHSLKKIPLLRIIVYHSQVYLVSHQEPSVNTRFHLPMDFISDVATMLKCYLNKSFFFVLFLIIIISAEIKKSYVLQTAEIFFRQSKKV